MRRSNMNKIDRTVRGAVGLLLVLVSPVGLDLIPSVVMGWFCLLFGAANILATLSGNCFMYSIVGISSADEIDASENTQASPVKLDYRALRRRAVMGFGAISLVVSGLYAVEAFEAAKDTARLFEVRGLHDATSFVVDELRDHAETLDASSDPLSSLSQAELVESLYHFDEPMFVGVYDGSNWQQASLQIDPETEVKLSAVVREHFLSADNDNPITSHKAHSKALQAGDLPQIFTAELGGQIYDSMPHELGLGSGSVLRVILTRQSTSFKDAIHAVVEKLAISSVIVFWLSIWGAVGVAYFISRRVEAANTRAYQLATTDSFTGLPNEVALRDLMHNREVFRSDKDYRIVGMHLRDLSTIASNTSFEVLSEMLGRLGKRLEELLSDSCHLARLSDGTVLLITAEDDEVSYLRFRELLNETQRVGDYRFSLEPTEVELHYPSDVESFESLRKSVIKLVGVARRLRLPILRFEHLEVADKRSRYAPEIRRALEQREFELYLQPKVNVSTREVCGAEALVRWNHPQDGLLMPGQFIEIIANSNVRSQFGSYIVEEVAELSRKLLLAGRDVRVSFNLSAEDVLDTEVQVKLSEVAKSLDLKNNPMLEIELTEGETAIDPARIKEALRILAWLGYRIALDDFGTGMSSLSYTHELPINTVKIDKSFVDNLDQDESAIVPIKAIYLLAQGYGYDVVAEGVERPEQLNALVSVGCNLIQGYIFAKPMPYAEFERFEVVKGFD